MRNSTFLIFMLGSIYGMACGVVQSFIAAAIIGAVCFFSALWIEKRVLKRG
ncbi:MAG TPA: hypothetical protein VND94_00810 [Terriglobia bacterium]|nr:hypothetical protein [Terriglobia bacterium]